MDDPGGVGGGKRLGDLGGQIECLLERQRTLLQRLSERFAFQVLLHHVVGAVLDAYVEDRCDVRVIQGG